MAEQSVALPLHIDDVLLDLIRQAQRSIPFDSGGLLLHDAGSGTLMPHAYLADSALRVPAIRVGEGVIGEAALSGQPVYVPDMRDDPRVQVIDPESRAELAVPVVSNGDLLGVFNVESRRPNAYTLAHVEMLRTLASQAAILIRLMRSYQELAGQQEALLAGIDHRQRETEAMLRLATITSATLNINELLTNAVRESAELLDCEGAQLLTPDHVAYVLNVHEPSVYGIAQSWPITVWPLDQEGYLVDVYHTGQPYYANTPPPEAEANTRNVLACPLNFRLRTLGVLHLVNRRSGPIDEEHIALAQAVANLMAVSLSSAQSFAAEHRRAEMLSQINQISQLLYTILDPEALLSAAAEKILEMFERDAAYIYLLKEDDKGQVEVRATAATSPRLKGYEGYAFSIERGLVGRVMRPGQSQNVGDVRDAGEYVPFEDPRRLQSSLVVPLRRGDEVIGAIEVASTSINAFAEDDAHALETMATMVGIALENARLHNQAQRRLMEQRIVHQIGQDLTAILNYAELAHALVEHMNRALNTTSCMVGLYEPAINSVRIEADYYAPPGRTPTTRSLAGHLLPLSERPSMALAIRERRPVLVYAGDSELDTDEKERQLLQEANARAKLVLPMMAGERVIGVVRWTDDTPGRRFTEEDVNLAQTLVSQATIAVDNALLFRQLETRAVELAEANRLRSQFLATISHELRTPMNSIIGFSSALLNGLYGELNEQQISRVERIERNGQTLLALIDDLLDLSKIDAGRSKLTLEVVNVRDVITAAVQSIEHQAISKDLTLTVDLPDTLPDIYADAQRYHQVITNLLSNAIKFTAEGGITVTCREHERKGKLYVETIVIDTGIGIAKANQSIIFDEFRQVDGSSTRAYGGTGLGLAISRRLVEMMKGAIWVESELGKGSAFHFIVPVATPENASKRSVGL